MTLSRHMAACAVAALAMCAFDPASAAGTLDKIRDSGALTIGYREAARPMSFVDDKGAPSGYSIDLCTRIAEEVRKELGLSDMSVKFVPVTAENRIQAVVDGTVDIECGVTTKTISRMAQVDFTAMVYLSGGAFLTLAEGAPERLSDLDGKKVGLIHGTTTENAVRSAFQRAGIDAEIVSIESHDQGVEAVESGTIDAYASDQVILIGQGYMAENPERLFIPDFGVSYEPHAFMVRRNDADFRLIADRTLAHIYRTGEISTIHDKWFGALGEPSKLLGAMYILNGLPE